MPNRVTQDDILQSPSGLKAATEAFSDLESGVALTLKVAQLLGGSSCAACPQQVIEDS